MTTKATDPTNGSDSQETAKTEERRQARVLAMEAVIGVLLGLALLAALVTSTAEIPFVYQGY